MEIRIGRLIEGARRAEGLAVVIDVFRAFSMECFLFAAGAAEVRPVGTLEETFAWRERDGSCLLVGERHGKMCEGFDMGNSPSSVTKERVAGRRVIHTTSAGTQGIINASKADVILTGSFVNARATAGYIRKLNPAKVSLICMGREGVEPAEEDELCAEYLRDLLEGRETPDIDARLKGLRTGGGKHFFDPALREVFPEPDFWLCIDRDRFGFAIRVRRDEQGLVSEVINIKEPPC